MIDASTCRFCIDEPKPLFATRGWIQFFGWCFDESSSTIPRVRLIVGAKTYHCKIGLPRPDVGAAFPQFPQAAASGFLLQSWMPLGYHPAYLELGTDDASWHRVSSLTLCAEIAPLIAHGDFPATDVVQENRVTVSGWAFHPQEPIERLILQVGGVSVECHYGSLRADVAANFPELPQSDRCGFDCQINVPAKGGSLTLKAHLRSGSIVLRQLKRRLSTPDRASDLSRQLPSDASPTRGARQPGPELRALAVDARVLCPDQDAGSVRMMGLLLILQELGFQVTFIPENLLRVSPYTEKMQELGVECLHAPFLPGFDLFFAERANEFDVIILSRAHVAEELLPLCRKYVPTTPIIFDTVDLHFVRLRREAELARDDAKGREADRMEMLELKLGAESDAIVVVSPDEKSVLEEKLPGQRIAVISNIHGTCATIPPFESRRDFLFIGGFEHAPNEDAILWFCGEIMPEILRELPNTTFHIIGSKMPVSVRALASDHVITHGYVEKVEPFFESCLLSVAPLRFGAGVKGKTNQSMSFGVPVVSTSMGAEGMHLTHEKDILLADEPLEFAQQVVRLHCDRDLWQALSRNGLKNIEEHFSSATAKHNLKELLTQLGVPSHPVQPGTPKGPG